MAESWRLNDSAPSSLGDEFGPPAPPWTSVDWMSGLGMVEPFPSSSSYLATVVDAGSWAAAEQALGAPDDLPAGSANSGVSSIGIWGFANASPAGVTPLGLRFEVTVAGSPVFPPLFESFTVFQNGVAIAPAQAGGFITSVDWQTLTFDFDAAALDGTFNNITVRVVGSGNPERLYLDAVRMVAVHSAPSATNGAAENLTSPTALTEPAGSQPHNGVVENLTSATALSEPTGNQPHNGVVESLTSATLLSEPAGTQVALGGVENLTSATRLTEPAGSQPHNGVVEALASATVLGEPAGDQPHAGVVENASSATRLSEPAGFTQTVESLTSATELQEVAGEILAQGVVEALVSATELQEPAGSIEQTEQPPVVSDGGGGSPRSGRIPFHLRVNMPSRTPKPAASEDWMPEDELFALAQALITSGVLEECP